MNWPTVTLGCAAQFLSGGTPSKRNTTYWNGDIPWVSPKDMGPLNITDAQDHITIEGVKNSSTSLIDPESILIVVRSGILIHSLPIGLVRRQVAINQDIKAIVPDQRFISTEYLAYWLRANSAYILSHCVKRGATVHSLVTQRLRSLLIPVPAQSEQLRIVKILDEAESLRNRRAEADAKARSIVSTLFCWMFGDPITNLHTDRWPLERIDTIADVSYGLSDRLDPSLSADQGTRIITISNVTLDGTIDESIERYSLADESMREKARMNEGDLLFNWRNGSKQHVGKTAIWENNCAGDVLHVSFLLRIRSNKSRVEPYYLWSLLNLLRSRGFFTAQSRMQVNSKFNASELSALRVPIPPLENQVAFSRYLRSFRTVNTIQATASKKVDSLFDVLLQRAFNGELTAGWRAKHSETLEVELQKQMRLIDTAQVSPSIRTRKAHAN